MKKLIISVGIISAIALFISLQLPAILYAECGNVLLWNKLGSVDEIANSEVGPGVQLTSYIYSDWDEAQIIPAQFGNGLFINHDTNEGWSNDGGNFFAINLNDTGLTPIKGTIEFWFKFKYDSSVHNHAYFFFTGNALTDHFPNSNTNTYIHIMGGWNGWDYGSFGKRFIFNIYNNSDSSGAYLTTPDYSAAPGGHLGFTDGTKFHFAFVWDLNGIDGTVDTVRMYINGNIEASSTEQWSTAGGFDPYLYLGTKSSYGNWDHHYNAVLGVTDNLIIWDYAKTDFSDRFIESPCGLSNQPPAVDTIVVPLDPVNINDQSSETVDVTFSDPDGEIGEPYTCDFDLDNDGVIDATVQVNDTLCSTPLNYAEPGVYTVSVTVTNNDGGSGSAEASDYIVIYDPEGGFVTGGGWLWSEASWCQLDDVCANAEGKAKFGFVSRYKKGATEPTGNTEFNFSAGGLNFHSSSYEWLVVTGSNYAKFKGVGTINGEGDYKFMIWAGDDEADTFRIKIWEEDEFGNETDIYDNGFDQEIGGGSIVIHTK